jgi:hypothetical protein
MCEYCGCQALASIALLTREHEAAVDLVYAATAALRVGDLDETRRLCADLRALLRPHTAVEEQALFVVMAVEFPDQIAALVEDHQVIEAGLAAALDEDPSGEDWQQRLAAALALLPGHILREQDGVFPAALTTLTPAEWDRLDAVREARGAAGRTVA